MKMGEGQEATGWLGRAGRSCRCTQWPVGRSLCSAALTLPACHSKANDEFRTCSSPGLKPQCGRKACLVCKHPLETATFGSKEKKINASHSPSMAGTIHLIALRNGFHKPLIIRLYHRN